MDCSPPGFSIHGILQARILEWVSILFSQGSSQSRDWTQVSHVAGGFFLFTVWATRGSSYSQASTKIEQDMMKPRGALGNHYQLQSWRGKKRKDVSSTREKTALWKGLPGGSQGLQGRKVTTQRGKSKDPDLSLLPSSDDLPVTDPNPKLKDDEAQMILLGTV